jgi:hypothetical protein
MTLNQILAEKPEKKEFISKNLVELVKGCMKKDIINLDFVHTCLLQALEISTPKDIEVTYPLEVLIAGVGFLVQRADTSVGAY